MADIQLNQSDRITSRRYNIGNITEVSKKFAIATSTVITNVSLQDLTSSKAHFLPMSFSSASSIPLALPGMVANGIGVDTVGFQGMNTRMVTWASNILTAAGSNALTLQTQGNAPPPNLQRVSGWLMMDFYDEPAGLVPLLVEMNWMNANLGIQSLPSEMTEAEVAQLSAVSTNEQARAMGWGTWMFGKNRPTILGRS